MNRAVWASLVVASLVAALGVLRMDAVATRGDVRLVATLPALPSVDGTFAEERARGDMKLGRTCIHHRCIAHVVTDSATRSFGPAFEQHANVRLLQSQQREQLILEADGSPVAVMAADPAAWEWESPSLFDTHRFRAAFSPLVTVAISGWLASLVLLAWRTRVRRRLAVLERADEARIDAGWLRWSEGSPPRRVTGHDDGPVLVHRHATRAAPYRGDVVDGSFDLLEGDREDNTRPLLRRSTRIGAAIVGLSAGTSMPLFLALFGSFSR